MRTPLRLTEAKMVGEYICYKVRRWRRAAAAARRHLAARQTCKLQLYHSPKAAVDQFQRHIRTFMPLTGPEVLWHEHWFYIAKQ